MITQMIGQQRRVLLFIVLASFFLRLTLVFALRTYNIPSEQDHFLFAYETGRVARSLAEGRGFSSPFPMPSGPTALLPPGYPMVLAGIFTIFGVYTPSSAAAALILNCLFAALTSIPLFMLGAELFHPAAGLIAAALFALYPPSIWHSVSTIWDTNLFTLGLAASALAIHRATLTMQARQWAAAGAMIALTSLVNPAGLSFFGLALAWAAFRNRRDAARALKGPAAATAAAGLVFAPWVVRNYAVFGEPVLRSGLALELKLGNDAVWNYDHPSFSRAEFSRYERLGEFQYMAACWTDAVSVIRRDPQAYAAAVARRTWRFWTGIFAPDRLNYDHRPAWRRLATNVLNFACLSLAIAGLATALHRGYRVGLLALMFAAFPAVYYFTRVCERYRFPMDPYLLLLCSFALYCVIERRIGRGNPAAGDRNAHRRVANAVAVYRSPGL
jgi:4-amino-4-deoxy-L-arabinose transferase-like glycosyltransferase